MLTLRTSRLELIAATADSVMLEMHDIRGFASALGVAIPPSWPPPLHDRDSQAWYVDLLRDEDTVGWGLWYVIVAQSERQLAGTAGFKGKPHDGSCEIGYSVLPQFQGSGYATEASRCLMHWAFQHPALEYIAAETLPDLVPSIRVMEKCGMRFAGDGAIEGDVRTVRYGVRRAEFSLHA